MKKKKLSLEDYNKPVAYDTDGRPLYAHPLSEKPKNAPINQTVHFSRPIDPVRPAISDATMLKHLQSKKIFSGLNLSEGEYVISSISRNPIGLIAPLSFGIFLIILMLALLFNLDVFLESFKITGIPINFSMIVYLALLFIILIILGMYVICYVYTRNKFYLTNESVIQEIQVSLFSKHEQTVSLINIEDASFTQLGIIQQMFNYGSIRLSTEGEETTYRFSYVSNPKEAIATLNNAVEAFKNGRAIIND